MSLLRGIMGMDPLRKAWWSWWLDWGSCVVAFLTLYVAAGLIVVAIWHPEYLWLGIVCSGPVVWLLVAKR